MRRRALGLVALAVVARPAVAQSAPAERLADLRLATAVRLALVENEQTRRLDPVVAANHGAVEIRGLPAADQAVAARVAREVPGVVRLVGLDPQEPAAPPTGIPARPAPAATPAARSPASPAIHTVRRGDTLFSIARRYDTTVETLQRLNDLRGTDIRVGQRLRVR